MSYIFLFGQSVIPKTLLPAFNRINQTNLVQNKFLLRCITSTSGEIKNNESGKKKKKVVYISLLGTDNKISYTTLEEATKLSNRRDLKLIKINDFDKKRQSSVYQLKTARQYLAEDINSKKSKVSNTSGFKSEKVISFSNKISEHDIQSKAKQIIKWTDKNHEVRATIIGSEPADPLAEKTFHILENALENTARILQKRSKGNDIKFQVIPMKKKKENSTEESIANTSDVTLDSKKELV